MFYDYLINSQGKEKAKQYLEANQQAIQNIEEIIQKEQIDCQLQKQNAYVYTQSQEEIPKLQAEVEAVQRTWLSSSICYKSTTSSKNFRSY